MEKLKGLDLEGKLVLDAGTGAGNMTKFLENWGAEVVSIDLDSEWQSKCRGEVQETQFITGDLSEMKFLKDDCFDYVVCNFVISALSETKNLLLTSVFREFYRVLKSKGMLVIIDYHPFRPEDTPSSLHDVQTQLWRLENAVSELLGKGHLEEYPPEVISKELKSIGFVDTDVSILMEKVPWPVDLLKEHESMIVEDIEKLEDQSLKEAFKKKLKELMDRAESEKVESGSIYELRAEV
ncbi:MAG: class I SAM-dependent methyltransferase [Candidatus Saliniplasma sp.]